ncbi:DUF3152 domain-containing protein [Actinoplanes sp. DH11]|uniref:DUF3152 domain-containing protein n=1 Tax=Actinoplanes sp. DH11 TaxID=2857011 RepID=UPI001E6340A0|nr:DUF3152 domain-containing protein [Actinoplanes sp. DH11]
MMSPASPPAGPRNSAPTDRWRQSWLVILGVILVLIIAVMIGNRIVAGPEPAGNAAAAASPTFVFASPADSASATPSPSASRALEASPSASGIFPEAGLLRLPGKVPTHGSGQFLYGSKRSPVLGDKGQLRRFRVAVEKGSNEDVESFGAQVRSILGDKRSWIGNDNVRLQMVTGADRSDFTVYLATRDTAGQMCARGGTNIRVGGVPYTSCRTPGKAVINLDRWRVSAKPYMDAKIGLDTYRKYVINHEVGHELGHGHQNCPKAGGPAPVMVQQTLTLRGCVPYAWPRRDNRSFTGPAI